jgi:hypothetical protein
MLAVVAILAVGLLVVWLVCGLLILVTAVNSYLD